MLVTCGLTAKLYYYVRLLVSTKIDLLSAVICRATCWSRASFEVDDKCACNICGILIERFYLLCKTCEIKDAKM